MIGNLIKENFSLNEKEQKVVDKIICDKMNIHITKKAGHLLQIHYQSKINIKNLKFNNLF